MPTSNQKKPLFLFGTLLFVGLLFSIPQYTYAVNFTAGWYQDQGATTDTSCGAGYWRAYVELKDYEGNVLVVDMLRIKAIYYPEPEGSELGVGYVIYDSGELNSLDSFETPCEIGMEESIGRMVLDIEASKDGYYTIKATNNIRFGGAGLNQKKWSKTLYLTPFTAEEPNLVYLFPEDNQWISGAEEYSEMKLWVNKAPLPDNITEIKIEIKHNETGQKFSLIQTTNIAEGEVVFSLPPLAEQGQYTWRVVSMKSTSSIFYNERADSTFYFDSLPPLLDYSGDSSWHSGEEQAPNIYARFYDNLSPASGIDKIELYLDDGYGGDLELVDICSYHLEWPRPFAALCGEAGEFEVYHEPRTYNWYAIAYDYVSNKTQLPTMSFTIEPIEPSTLAVRSNVALNPVTGVPFKVTEIIPDDPEGAGVPEVGDYQTNETFYGYQGYRFTLEAPDSYSGVAFSFWELGSQGSNGRQTSSKIPLDNYFYRRMYFGVSKLRIERRQVTNTGSMSPALKDYIFDEVITRIEQIGGTPSDLLGPDGYLDVTYNNSRYSKKLAEEIKDIVLRIYPSEDGILQPAGLRFSDFCEPDPAGSQEQCKGSIGYISGKVTPYYDIQRKVTVVTFLGSDSVAGVNIDGEGAMLTGETPYTISSIEDPDDFVGTLWAPPSIIDPEGNEVLFGGWSGCQSVSPDNLGCYVGEGTWYDNVTTTVIAYYAGEPEPATPELTVGITAGNGTVTSNVGDICCGCVPTSNCFDYFATGTEVTLTANPVADSYFVGWTGNCAFSGNNATCTMDSDRYAQAEFALITYDLTPDSTAGGSVTTPGEATYSYDVHTVVDLATTADSGYQFVNWTGSDVSTIADVNSATTTITMEDNYSITANFEEAPGPDSPSELTIADWDHCTWQREYAPGQYEMNSFPTFQWKYSHPNGAAQQRFNIRVRPDTSFDLGIDCGLDEFCLEDDSSALPNATVNRTLTSGEAHAWGTWPYQWGAIYYWIIKVKDVDGNWSNWSSPSSENFTTPDHSYPLINFDWVPDPPSVGQVVEFRDHSVVFNGKNSWEWTFPATYECVDPEIGCEIAENPQIKFSTRPTAPNDKASLKVTDSRGSDFYCRDDKEVFATLPLPEYKEVPPVSRLKNFLARLNNISMAAFDILRLTQNL